MVLDHSSHVSAIRCSADGKMEVCFEPAAFAHTQETWSAFSELNIITYHIGCGDEYNGQRSFFLAEDIEFDNGEPCVSFNTTSMAHEHAVSSGELSWGTYQLPTRELR